MHKRTATLILNRNLPSVTAALAARFAEHDKETTDVYIVESGSEPENLPSQKHWWADWPEARELGLRYPRGFNFGLLKLLEEDLYHRYDYFFLVCNDIEFSPGPIIGSLVEMMEHHPRLGILSPLSPDWGEKALIPPGQTRYFWHLAPNAWLIRRQLVECVRPQDPTVLDLLFDGTNFRGYGAEMELVAKAYANDWAAGITSAVTMNENESLLLDRSELIRTDPWEKSLKLASLEGREWMRRKYGFNSRWTMQAYVKFFYDKFFDIHPEVERYRI